MKRSFRIAFTRKANGSEFVERPGWFEAEDKRTIDSTEFDVECSDAAPTVDEIFPDLMNLFNGFIAENNFESIEVVQVEEVPYNGD